jgi:hypothetical protein
VDPEIGAHRAQQPNETEVLDEHSIDAGVRQLDDVSFNRIEFRWEDECIECDVSADASFMEMRHHLRQRVEV